MELKGIMGTREWNEAVKGSVVGRPGSGVDQDDVEPARAMGAELELELDVAGA